MRVVVLAALVLCASAPGAGPGFGQQRGGAAQTPAVRAEWAAALERVSADSLRGHLSFIASDLLEGRNTPSRGLDIAAEYIAAQFRRAGLEPAGEEGGYFQTATWGEIAATSRRPRQLTPEEAALKVRNVAGLLRGSDASLKDTYVIVSAHYDHVGVRSDAPGDQIFNGANDDGSGTVSVVEIASALASLKQRPKRSILFLAFFGEEKGLLGSRHYGRRPLVPLAKTVAQLNLEHLGRTDDSEGPQVGTITMTGFDYTDLGETLSRAGAAVGRQALQAPAQQRRLLRSQRQPGARRPRHPRAHALHRLRLPRLPRRGRPLGQDRLRQPGPRRARRRAHAALRRRQHAGAEVERGQPDDGEVRRGVEEPARRERGRKVEGRSEDEKHSASHRQHDDERHCASRQVGR